jgi:F-type H+-transporting ATPase subunit delta
MAAPAKRAQLLARRLFRLAAAGGPAAPEQVAGVLAWVEKHRPPHARQVLKAYGRLVAAELARGRALVEHAGPVSDKMLHDIAADLARKYRRPIAPAARPNPALLAGLRVRVGDDVYEASAAAQLAALAASV